MQISCFSPLVHTIFTPIIFQIKIIFRIVSGIFSLIRWLFGINKERTLFVANTPQVHFDRSERVQTCLEKTMLENPLRFAEEKDRCEKDMHRMTHQSVFIDKKKAKPTELLEFIAKQPESDQLLLYFFSEQNFLNGVIEAREFEEFGHLLAGFEANQHLHIRKGINGGYIVDRSQTNFIAGLDPENPERYFTIVASACFYKGQFSVKARFIQQDGAVNTPYTKKSVWFNPVSLIEEKSLT